MYGSAKAALTTFLQGLRNRLFKSNVHVTTVKPGFVDTAMTWGLPGLFLVATPDQVAADVYRAVSHGRGEVYTPFFWRYIMLIIKSVPEVVFKAHEDVSGWEVMIEKLSLTNFKGFRELRLDRLSRITLLGGENSVGKTSVLEAVLIAPTHATAVATARRRG